MNPGLYGLGGFWELELDIISLRLSKDHNSNTTLSLEDESNDAERPIEYAEFASKREKRRNEDFLSRRSMKI